MPPTLLRDSVGHFLLCNLVAAVFLAVLCECSKGPFLGSHGILQVLVQRRERPTGLFAPTAFISRSVKLLMSFKASAAALLSLSLSMQGSIGKQITMPVTRTRRLATRDRP